MSQPDPFQDLSTEFRIDESEHVDGTETVVVIPIHGDTDMHVVEELKARLSEAIDESPAAVVLDLSGVTFLDSIALGVLLGSLRTLGAAGGQLRVVAPRPEIRRIFEVTLLDRVFAIDSSRDEALDAITAPA
ncbi:MAG: STAS domain-containing protein [Actinobacteria bacterium]|nr:STAS domain-containing protein [Actinomycetota bacterium]